MKDLRAAVETLRTLGMGETDFAQGYNLALKYVSDLIPEGSVLVVEEPDSCPCGHEDNSHVHYCSADVAVGWCGCAAEYVRVDR